MLDANGREFKKIVSVAAAAVGARGMTECYLECGHMVCMVKPAVGKDARCKRCERHSERTDKGDNRQRVVTGRAA